MQAAFWSFSYNNQPFNPKRTKYYKESMHNITGDTFERGHWKNQCSRFPNYVGHPNPVQ